LAGNAAAAAAPNMFMLLEFGVLAQQQTDVLELSKRICSLWLAGSEG
jgi:hypothetical protein